MSEWKEYKFRELLEEPVRNGIYKKKEYHGRGTKIVNMGELFAYPRLTNVEMKRVEINESERSKCLLKKGDLIFARRSLTAEGAGKCSLVYKINEDVTFESSIIRARPNQSKASSEFLYYYFNSPYGNYLLGTILRQVAVSGITGTDLMDLVLNIPNKETQISIAKVFSSLDDKIDLLHRQNKTLEQLAETLFRQWFVDEADDEWEGKSLDEIAEYLNGLALQKFPSKGLDDLPVVKIREMKQGISKNTDRCSREIPLQYIVQDGDVLFSWSGSLEVVIWHDGEGALNQHLFKVSSEKYPKWFYYLATKHHLPTFKSIAESKTTTMGHIQREHLKQATISIPPSELFNQYDKVISPLVEKEIKNNNQIRTLTQLRDILLPKLMSGEVRVNN